MCSIKNDQGTKKTKGPYFPFFTLALGLDGLDFSGFSGVSVAPGFAGSASWILSKNCLDFLGTNPNIDCFFYSIIT